MEKIFSLSKGNRIKVAFGLLALVWLSACNQLETAQFVPKPIVSKDLRITVIKNGEAIFNIADSVRPQIFSTLTLTAPKNGIIFFDTTTKLHNYQPVNGFLGGDTAGYEICQNGECAKGKIVFTVKDTTRNRPDFCTITAWSGSRVIELDNPDTMDLSQFHSTCGFFDTYEYVLERSPVSGECFQAYTGISHPSNRGKWIYQPSLGFEGEDSIQVRVIGKSLSNNAIAQQSRIISMKIVVTAPNNPCFGQTNLISDTLLVRFGQLATVNQSFIVDVEDRLRKYSTLCQSYEFDKSRISVFQARITFPLGLIWGPIYGSVSHGPFGDKFKLRYTPLPGLSSSLPVNESFRVKIWLKPRNHSTNNSRPFSKEVIIYLRLVP